MFDPGTHTADGDMGTGYWTLIPNNGRIIQNIIHGCDTVMSHITHLYHLSALDFINTSSFPGMSPWTPSYTASDMLVATGLSGSTANNLVAHYVEALSIRRKCHTASALFSGRHPIQNAMVPGGVTTLFSSTYPYSAGTTDALDTAGYDRFGPFNAADTKTKFNALLTEIRTFINTKYVPDVVTVANAYSGYWNIGQGCQRLLAYGDFPVDTAGTLLLKRGVVNVLTPETFDAANIVEYVGNSWYSYGILDSALHPYDGRTEPNKGTGGYSWLKSPRLVIPDEGGTAKVCEVGPLARMVNTYVSGTQVQVDDTVTGGTSLGEALGGASLGLYTADALVNKALDLTLGAHTTAELAKLYSPLGRHAARALEAKYIADAMADWVDELVADAPGYVYKKIPKQISKGAGLCEAPRGALGHWIKIEGKKVAKYQCVVPSTWNFSPEDDLGQKGPVEQSLMDSSIGTNPTDQIVNILRVVHPFDCCIACAVHVVTPEGKEKLRFAIGPDGRPANIEIAE